MIMAKKTKSLAPEQYGSRNKHKAIDLAVNKALAYDILQQQKRPGALCSNDAKMQPILHYGLPALGICRNFPRKMVFAPHKYMGLGFKHLHYKKSHG